jgi:hypothetical protein
MLSSGLNFGSREQLRSWGILPHVCGWKRLEAAAASPAWNTRCEEWKSRRRFAMLGTSNGLPKGLLLKE